MWPLTKRSPGDSAGADALREALIAKIATQSPWPIAAAWDARVLAAMAQVPRHLFAPNASLRDAYADEPYPIGFGQTVSQPTVVALMTQALNLTGTERVLEIGTGSGYQTAVLSLLAANVFTIERVSALSASAQTRLLALGAKNVVATFGDGFSGLPEHAPFDRILITAAPDAVPTALFEQLCEDGLLVAPVGKTAHQTLFRWRKTPNAVATEELLAVRFVPMLHGAC